MSQYIVSQWAANRTGDREDIRMVHSFVSQLRFARAEFRRSLDGVTEEEACRLFPPINCISWMLGHMASQEQRYWCDIAQGDVPAQRVYDLTMSGQPATTPSLQEMWADWEAITKRADVFLDGLTAEQMSEHFERNGRPVRESIGSMLLRNIYHYWFHNGEAQAVRQLLGHTDLPQFVGPFTDDVIYRPDR